MAQLSGLELKLVQVLRGAKRHRPVEIGPVHFYHFWHGQPKRGAINVAWIKDLRVAQFAQAGYREDYLLQAQAYLAEDRRRFAPVNAFVAPTPTFAGEVNRWYAAPDQPRPFFCFANYPDRTTVSATKRNLEIVYVDYASTVFQEEFYRALYGLFDQLHVLCGAQAVVLVNIFRREANSVPHGDHIRIASLRGSYDCRSRYGILVNLTNFKQAAECLPRKLLLYAHWGMTPLLHGTFDESIRFCRKYGAYPVVYWGAKELAAELAKREKWAERRWRRQVKDPARFCIEERVGDLVQYLKGLGG